MSFPSARRSLSSASSTTVSSTSRRTTNASPESLGSLALHTVSVYLQAPENQHLVIPQEHHSALIAFLKGDFDSLRCIQSTLLGSTYTRAYLYDIDVVFVGNARVVPVNDLAQVLATIPFRHRVASMVLDVMDNFIGVPESLVMLWHARLSHYHGHLSLSHERPMEPSISCLPLLSELPSITVAQFLSCLNNRDLLISQEVYDMTVQALAKNAHSSVSPLFRHRRKEGVALRGGRLFVGTRTVITIDQLSDVLKLLPSTASENHMVGISQRCYCGVPEALVRDWHRRLSQYAAEDMPAPRLELQTSAAGTRRMIPTREEGREDALPGSGSQDLRDPSSMHGERTGRKRAREDEGEDEDAPRSKRQRLGDILLWVWRTVSHLRFRQRR